MRTFEEINTDITKAKNTSDAEALLRYAAELDTIATPQAEALACNAHGLALHLRGDYPAALAKFQRALALHEELGNRSGVAGVTGNIGTVYQQTEDFLTALEYYQRAMILYEELGKSADVAIVMGNIGNVYTSTGDYPAALDHFHRALALHDELGDRTGVARINGNIGNMLKATGDYPTALEHYHRSLALQEELGDRNGAAASSCNIGVVHMSIGNYPEALLHYHHALDLFEELGAANGVQTVTVNIGILHGTTGDHSASLECFHRALTRCEEMGKRLSAAHIIGNIGNVHRSAGDHPAALEHYHRALALFEELGYTGVASVTGNIVSAYLDMNSDELAKEFLTSLDAIQIGDPNVRIERQMHHATLQERSGDLVGAVVILQGSLAEAVAHKLLSLVADIHKALRDLALKLNDFAGYVEHNNEFMRITEEINGKDTALKISTLAKQREIDIERRVTEKHMAVLHSTLPKHVAERVARGEVVNDQFDNASVIFLDIVGFTSISDHIPSGHVVHLLEQIFTTLDAVCEKHNVVKIKTIGDSYMAVSFESVPNAATCALDMIASLDALEITMPPSLGDTSWTKDVGDIKVRVGIHCGPLTAGVIGTARMQYDVWGDTVNVASRMESTGEPDRVHVSEAFAVNLKSDQESRIKNPISETHEVSHESVAQSELVTSHSSLLTQLVTPHFSLVTFLRGSMDIKGKGMMNTYWLENASA